ncbi:MAG: response regulator [Dysgonamonadaceae bacterium]|jgi:signal transduction histidine kinase/ligand-binding sensor domain-containing protein/DNA-binding response OmpR family regulator|nr:response regulator [Dysgonamonadaceae bacterium]
MIATAWMGTIKNTLHRLGSEWVAIKRLIVALLLSALSASAQPLSCFFEHYSTEDGLPQSTVMDIIQDRKGFMWFATWDGISKFDGHTFRNYKVQSGDTYYMNSNRIESFAEDRYGNLWLRSYDGGAHCFDPQTETFKGLQSIPGYADYSVQITKIETMPSGKVWLLSENSGCICIADSSFAIQNYTRESGRLRGNTVYSVFEDRENHSWILTNNGLYLIKNEKTETIPFFFENNVNRHSQSFHAAIEWEDEIWFGASRGRIWKYKKATGKFDLLETPAASPITGFQAVDEKAMAIATSGDGFFIYHPESNRFETFNTSTNKTLKNNAIEFLLFDSLHQLWFVTNELGIYKLDTGTQEIRYFLVKTEDANMMTAPSLPLVIEDVYGQIWVHPKGGGFSVYNKPKDSLEPFYNNSVSPDWRFSNILHVACSDKQGNLWLSTRSNGLEKVLFGSNYFRTMQINPDLKSSTANDVRAVLQDNENRIWIATKSCHLIMYDEHFNRLGAFGNDGSVRRYQVLSGMVYSMMQDHTGAIWIGTRNEGILKVRKTTHPRQYEVERFRKNADIYSLSEDAIYSIFEDSKQNIWIGTYGGGLNLVQTTPEGKTVFINHRNQLKSYPIETNHRIRYISENKFGNICIGTTAGLVLFSLDFSSPENIEYKHYTRLPGDKESLTHNDIHSICNTRAGEMFIATFGGGLNKVAAFDEQGFPLKFKSYTTKDGLPSDVCLAILEDEVGKLWVSMETTLSKFDPEKEEFETFAEIKRVMSQHHFSEASATCLNNRDVLFGFSDGVVSFTPDHVKTGEFKPYIALSDFRLFNRPVPVGGKKSPLSKAIDDAGRLVLNHHQNFFSIEFTALDFVLSNNILYAYQLEGFDKDWIYPQKQRIANYTNIPKGKYIFRVKSTNHEGIWVDNERQLPIQILPSFWETAWAYLLYCLLLLGIVFLIIYLSVVFYRLRSKVKMEKRMSEMKLSFFTDISHEIRTPLTMITAPVDYLMTEPGTPEKIRKQLSLISQNTNRLLRLVNQILDFRKVQQFKLTVQEIDLGAMVENFCRNFEEPAQQRRIHFRFINQAPNEKVWVDLDCLEKIVINLLSNAFKYTPDRKSIRVMVKGTERFLQVEVADEGRGIPKDRQKNLFTRFMSYNEDKNQPSTGIGLFIVKDLVDKHGGKITIESEVNEGSVFTVGFLRGAAHFGKDVEMMTPGKEKEETRPPVSKETTADQEENREKRRSILLVEDDADLRAFVKTTLEEEYTVMEAKNGLEGWEKARKALPDFVVSDIMMPEMDGIELLQKLKEDFLTSHIPVILLTAKTMIESKLEGITYGADDYITKPFNIPYFKARIRNLFEQRKRLQEIYRSRLTDIVPQEPAEEEPKPFIIPSQDEILLKKAVQIIETRIDDSDFSVDDLVTSLGMSRSVFFNKVKSLTGLAPIEFIRDLKMKRAAELLASGDYLVKEVSYMIGISDTKYFGKCFKTKFGITPQDYKNRGLNLRI